MLFRSSESQVVYLEDDLDGSEPLSESQTPDESRQRIENHGALSTQLQQHIDHDVNAVLPQLHGILANLSNPAHFQLRNSEAITEFRSVLEALEDAFAKELCHTSSPNIQTMIIPEGNLSTSSRSYYFTQNNR